MSSTTSRSKKSRSKRWDVIDFPTNDQLELMPESDLLATPLPDGFCVRFFRHDMQHLYTVASDTVTLTRGVLDYLHDYNQLGPNKSRNKLFVCSQYDKEKRCVNGSLCREVHCSLNVDDAVDAIMYYVPSNATGSPNLVKIVPAPDIQGNNLNKHFHSGPPDSDQSTADTSVAPMDEFDQGNNNNNGNSNGNGNDSTIYLPEGLVLKHTLHSRWTSKSMYSTLPPGVMFKIALPNTPTPVDQYDSGELFVTKGAQEFYDHHLRSEPTTVTMQHCAHYSKNGICCFGEDCQFVHVLHYRARERPDYDGGSCSDADVQSSCSSSVGERRQGKGKRANSAKETPLSMHVAPRGGFNKDTPTSRSSSANGSTNTYPGPPGMSAGQPGGIPSNCVIVPASSWAPHGHMAPQNPQGGMGQPGQIMYSTMAPHQSAPQQVMVPPGYMMMQGPSGEMFLLPQGNPQPQPQPQQQQQQIFVMPMPSYQ